MRMPCGVSERFLHKNCAGSADNRYRGKREYTKCTKKSKLRWGMETTDVDKMKKLSTIRNQKMPKNRVIHEVMNIIHIIWDKLFVDDRDKNKRLFC